MRIPVVIFTFGPDHACTVVAARAAMRAGFGPVFIEDDGAKPLPSAARDELGRMGCSVRSTSFKRVGNLRGLETYKGLLAGYDHVFRSVPDAGHLVKLDADTIVARGGRLFAAAKAGVSAAGMTHGPYPFYGWCMLLSRKLVEGLREWVDRWGGFPDFDNRNFPEDQVTGTMSMLLNRGKTLRWTFDPEGGFGAGYQYSRARDTLDDYAAKYDVVTFGNRHLIPGRKSSCSKRDDVAVTMMQFDRILTGKIPQPNLA